MVPVRIAIQGEQGSFSHEAALSMGRASAGASPFEIVFCALSSEVFRCLQAREVDAAVIPIENSLAGSVLEHYDLLLSHGVHVEGELLLRIRHHLVAAPGVRLSEIREVYSHPVALAQCRGFFAAHPSLRALPFYDTAGSAAHAVATGAPCAGISSEHAARLYGGKVLRAGIEDHPANFTRFLLLRPGDAAGLPLASLSPFSSGAAAKVSVAFAVPHRAGSLVEALQIFARHGLNLTRLESRPVPGSPWEYVFYADYQLPHGSEATPALAELASLCLFSKQLGCYPEAAPLSA